MFKRNLFLIVFSLIVAFALTQNVLAVDPRSQCDPNNDTCSNTYGKDFFCKPSVTDRDVYVCKEDSFAGIFGKIKAPDALKGLVAQDPSGTGGLSIFFSNLITLFYIIATLVLIFMIVWGAFDWITSEGNKEKVESARNKIINAIIGILLFAAAFGIIQILGTFTGFHFFVGQK